MRNFIKKLLHDKLYIGSLVFVLILYITRTNYIKNMLFGTTNISTIREYSLVILCILGSTMIMGTILFGGLCIFRFVFKKVTLPALKSLKEFGDK